VKKKERSWDESLRSSAPSSVGTQQEGKQGRRFVGEELSGKKGAEGTGMKTFLDATQIIFVEEKKKRGKTRRGGYGPASCAIRVAKRHGNGKKNVTSLKTTEGKEKGKREKANRGKLARRRGDPILQAAEPIRKPGRVKPFSTETII